MTRQKTNDLYTPSVGIQVTEGPDIQASSDRLAATLQDFNQKVQGAPQDLLRHEGEVQRQVLQNNISVSYESFANEAIKHPNAAQGLVNYDTQARGYASKLMANVGPANKDYTENLLNYYANTHRLTVQNKVFEQAQLGSFQTLVNHSLQLTNDIDSAIHNGNTPQALWLSAQQRRLYGGALMTGVIDKREYARALPEFQKSFQIESALKQYSDSLNNGRANEFLDSFEKKDVPFISEQEKLSTLYPLFRKMDNYKLMELGITQGQIKDLMQQDIESVRAGGMPNARVAELIRSADPNAIEGYNESINDARAYYGQTNYLMSLPPIERAQALEQLRPKDPNSEDYLHQASLFKDISSGVSNLTKNFNEDPKKFILEHPVVRGLINKRVNGEQINALSPYSLKMPINDPVNPPDDDIVRAQQIMGRGFLGNKNSQIRLLDNSERQQYIAQLGSVDANQKIAVLNNMRDYYGKNFPIVLNDLKEGGMPSSWQLLAKADPRSPYANDAATALTSPKTQLTNPSILSPDEKDRIDNFVSNSNQTDILLRARFQHPLNFFISPNVLSGSPSGDDQKYKYLLDSYSGFSGGNTAGFVSTMNEGIKKIAYQIAVSKGLSAQDAAASAMSVFTNNYNYRLYKNQPLRIPVQYNPDTVLGSLEAEQAKLQHFDFQLGGKPIEGLTPEQAHDYLYRTVIAPGHWVNDNLDRSLVWVDINGRPVQDSDGHVFSKPFDDAHSNFPTHQLAPNKMGLMGNLGSVVPEDHYVNVKKIDNLSHLVNPSISNVDQVDNNDGQE